MHKLFSLLLIIIITISTGAAVGYGKTNASVSPSATTNKQDETERFEQIYPFDSNGRIEIGNINGSVTVEAWDNPQIKLEYVKVAGERERLADVDVRIEAGQRSFRVKTDYVKRGENRNSIGKLYVEFRLTVPRSAALSEIASVNGNIFITNMTGTVQASAVNGNVQVKNSIGKLDISTVNGRVSAEMTQMGAGSDIKLSTVNGSVNLYLPSFVDARFSGNTVNGSIETDFGLTVTKSKYGMSSSLSGTLGGGGSRINLTSVNGTIAVREGNATNL